MMVRRRLRLPDGYSAKQVGTDWHLTDPRGTSLFRYPDATTVEAFAWRHARRTQSSVDDEPPGPRDVVEAPPNATQRRRRVKPISWRAVAAAIAGAVLGLAFLVRNPQPASIFAQPKPPGAGAESAGLPEMAPTATPRHRAPEARYAVSVGAFRNPAAADWMKHLVRSKGYIVDVVRRGAVSQVVTPAFRTRAQAERVARGFAELQLPAHLVAPRAM